MLLLSLATFTAALVGCGSARTDGPWVWSAPEPLPHPGSLQAELDPMRSPVHGSVAVFPGGGFAYGTGPETTRRDSLLVAAGSGETVPNRLDWPRTPAPTLDRTRTIRTGRNADSWTYPTTGRDGYGRGHGSGSSSGSGHGYGHGPYGEWRIRP